MESSIEKIHLDYYDQDLIAKSVIQTLFDISQQNSFSKLIKTSKILLQKHDKSVVTKNSIKYFIKNLSNNDLLGQTKNKKNKLFSYYNKKHKELSKIVSKKLVNHSRIFIHSINKEILDIINYIAANTISEINTIQHTPFFLGNKLSQNKSKIKTNIFFDEDINKSIENSTICLIGADAITNKGDIICKYGSNDVIIHSKKLDIPSYIITNSLKQDNENTSLKLLDTKYKYLNMYEKINDKKINGVILEHGIFKPHEIYNESLLTNKLLN
jgi:translation initiation factor 2B subunit (eIF-2B alpha/beta/delta family)